MVSTLGDERSCFLTCGVGKDDRRAEVCLDVGWRLGAGVKQLERQALDMLVRNATRLRMVPDELWTGQMSL